jgi:predicted nuclease with TOPRIM domain
MEDKEERINRLVVEIIILKEENSKLSKQNKTLSDAFNLLNKNYGIMVDDIERLKQEIIGFKGI